MPVTAHPTSAKVATPRKEAAKAARFNPYECAIALELLKAEQEGGPGFPRLANAFSALYLKAAKRSD